MKEREARLSLIKELIVAQPISSQEELLKKLQEHGIYLTQATLSRDFKALRLIKRANENGILVYSLPERTTGGVHKHPHHHTGFHPSALISLDFAYHQAIIKTLPGFAGAIAIAIDQQCSKLILGTIAGDDTILIIPKETTSREEFKDSLQYLFANGLK